MEKKSEEEKTETSAFDDLASDKKTDEKLEDKKPDQTEVDEEETKKEESAFDDLVSDDKKEDKAEEKKSDQTEVDGETMKEKSTFDDLFSGDKYEDKAEEKKSDKTKVDGETKEEKSAFDDISGDKKEDKLEERKPEIDGEDAKTDEKTTENADTTKSDEKKEDTENKDDSKTTEATNDKKEDGEETKKEDGDVVTIIDDGKDEPPEKTPDEIYYENLNQDELEWYKEHGPNLEEVRNKCINCTICQRQLFYREVRRHPALGVVICKSCLNFYGDGEWKKDDDGCDEFCRWCAQGGDILLCDKCPNSFCKRCLQRHLGRKQLAIIQNAEEWKCLVCDPKQIFKFRAYYYAISKSLDWMRPPKVKPMSEEMKEKRRKTLERKAHLEENMDQLEKDIVQNPENFIDENISSAFKTLQLYQQALEDERKRWIRQDKNMSPEACANLVRSLRRIYATTKKNMGLLDAALVQSYIKQFPRSKKDRLDIGKLTPSTSTVTKRKASGSSPRKSLPKKRRRNDVIELNGSPVTQRVDPSAMLQVTMREGRRNRAGPKSSKKNYTVSTNLFKKRAAAASKDDDDSDIECVEVMKPSIMKKKMGPKSRVG